MRVRHSMLGVVGVLRTFAADAVEHPQDWSPVRYIRTC